MKTISFAYNEDTLNTEIILLEDFDINNAQLVVETIKSSDDDEYYELDLSEDDKQEISNLKFEKIDDAYSISFDAKIILSDTRWEKADKKFKDCALNGLIEIDFSLKIGDEIFEEGDHFEKESDGQTKLFLD